MGSEMDTVLAPEPTEQKVTGLGWFETLHILLQVEREIEAELREQNAYDRWVDEMSLRDKINATRAKAEKAKGVVERSVDAISGEFDDLIAREAALRAAAAAAVAPHHALMDEQKSGIDELANVVKDFSNSPLLENSETQSAGSKEPTVDRP